MRNIKLTIEYDGTCYHGWQTQKKEKTVQQILEQAISKITNSQITLHGAGRTDAGVHALGQVAHFMTDSDLDLAQLSRGLNSLLPADIVIKKTEEAAIDFHARYSAKSRTYWYLIWNCPGPSAFYYRFSWHIVIPLNIAALKQAAACLIGVHDFTSFQGADKENSHAVREVTSIRFKRARRHLIICEIKANAFLKHMVRNIVGTLVEVGRGKMTVEAFENIFKKTDRRLAGPTAPAQGLFLKEIEY